MSFPLFGRVFLFAQTLTRSLHTTFAMRLCNTNKPPFKYWDRYIESLTTFGYERFNGPFKGWEHVRYIKRARYGLSPVTSDVFRDWNISNAKNKFPPVEVFPNSKWNIFKGDRVLVLHGPDKGRQGTVQRIIRENNWILVEGLHCKFEKEKTLVGTTYYKRSPQPLIHSLDKTRNQVALVDPEDFRATTILWKFDKGGKRVRVSARSGRVIPLPMDAFMLPDGVNPLTYVTSKSKDTETDDVLKRTFNVKGNIGEKIKTFEEEVSEDMGLDEASERLGRKHRNFWY